MVATAFTLVMPLSLMGQDQPWEREWEQVPIPRAFSELDEHSALPAEGQLRTYWDAEAAQMPEWHVFHMLMLVESGGQHYRRFATSLVNCEDRLRLGVRETFIEGSEIAHDEILQEGLWLERVRTLLTDDPAHLRESFERWVVDGDMACTWIDARTPAFDVLPP